MNLLSGDIWWKMGWLELELVQETEEDGFE